ncbi:MAG TPA: hypothetical protein VII12_16695 [Thermoanaerobaculia bacterium]
MKIPVVLVFAAMVALPAAAEPMVEVSAPAAGTTLRGGAYALLSWRGERLPTEAQEWEAFLSTDGGAHYGFRITPHLDLSLRSVIWLVPNIDAADARILIRVGDERKEQVSEVPLSFSITHDRRGELPPLNAVPVERGESARDGEEGVVWWVQGDRAGSGARPVASGVPPGALASLREVAVHDSPPAEVPKQSSLIAAPPLRVASIARQKSRNDDNLPLRAADILQLSHRQNI